MDDLLRDLIRRAESSGGAEWLRRCLDQPPVVPLQPGSPGPSDAAGPSGLCSDAAPPVQVDRGRSRRSSRRARPYSPHPSPVSVPAPQRRRNVNRRERSPVSSETAPVQRSSAAVQQRSAVAASRPASPATASQPVMAVASGEQPSRQQQEPPFSAASGEPQLNAVSNLIPPDNVALFGQLLTQLCQFINVNPIVATGIANGAARPVSASAAVPEVCPPVPLSTPVTAVWANNDIPSTSTDLPCLDRRGGVAEGCFKEAITCDISPLGFHLPASVKEKIWRQEYVDILSLIPVPFKDLKSDKKQDDKEEERKRLAPRSFYNWVQAFCIYASILGEKSPHLCSGLFRHMESILEAHKNFGGNAWFLYDESFRQKLSIYPGIKWGSKDVGLWINLMLPQRSSYSKPASQLPNRKGVCFAYNDSQCKFEKNCRYRHECTHCAGAHPGAKCFKKSQKEPFPKGPESGDAGKANAVARGVSRPADSGNAN